MKIHIIRECASQQQVAEMLECHGDFIQLTVDVERCERGRPQEVYWR